MEDNIKKENIQQKDKKNKLPLIAMLASMLACCCIFAVLCVLGVIPIKTGVGYIDLRTAAVVKQATEVSDEETLRELLLLKKELSIVVTEDIEIDETFIVKGKKTLYGDATISADVAGEYRTMYIFDVQPGAALTMNGLVLDGDGTADGINVGQDAELTYLSGTIQYMRYGIQTNGKVNFEDGLIQHITQAGIMASYRSKVYVNGGHLYNANSHLIHVDTNGYVEVNEGADLSVCRGDAIFNAGDLYVYGGTIHDTVARAINTEGKLHMEYKGSKKDGYIEMYNIGSIAVRMNAHDKCYISDVHAVNVGTNGVFTTDLRSNGKTTVENCIFDTCAIVEGNGMSVSRKVEVNDVTILNSQGGGINIRENGDVKLDGITIDGTKGDGITIGGELEASNIRLANVQANNIEIITGMEATISDSVLGKSTRTSVYMRKESTLTLDSVEVQGVVDEGIFNFHVNEGSVLNLKGDTSITGATRVAICLYKNTTLNMEDGKIFGINGTDNGTGVWIREEGAVFNMTGGSIENNTTTASSGGVFVADKTTFNMSGGSISGNSAKFSGGGVQVQGTMNFSGGTISNNKAETTGGGINVGNNASKGIYGKLNMTGGTVSDNYSINNGGGISVSGKTTANISGGTIKNNRSDGIGDGIHDNGNLTISGKAYIPGNTIGLNNKSVVLNIKGSSLSKHNAKDPLLVVPVQSTFTGDIVVKCDSESAVDALLNNYVVSGNNAFTLAKQESNMTVNPNMADLNTTGAETVYVSNFQELKEAVESTKTKRNIVIGADIEMESKITVPSGTTVCIRDDGQVRTLSRQAGNTQKFFETWYGTGLVLKGTSEEKLVLDGGNADNKAEDYQQLVYVRGATKIENVAFANNGVGDKYTGTFVNQQYGAIEIVGSTFENGLAVDGGAIYTKAGEAVITDCTFINNESTNRGGAICNANCETVITNSTFKNNTAATSGGAIYNAENGDLTLVGTSAAAIFEGNTSLAGVGGGAITVGTGTLDVDGYTFKNNVAENGNGGAIQVNSTYSVASIANSVFDSNKNTDKNTSDETIYHGGAIYTKAKELNVADTTFTSNHTPGQGGAINTQGKALNVIDCTFGGENVGNVAAGNGGAIYNGNKCTTTITSSKDAVFAENKSETGTGGAICVGTGHLEINGYTFDGNISESSDGGAIRLNADEITAEITDSVFVNNNAVNGGAISNAAKTAAEDDVNLLVSGCTFGRDGEGNSVSAQGGAIYTKTGKASIENTTFTDNESNGNGGALYNGDKGILVLAGTDATALFEGNTSKTGTGGAICVGTGHLEITGYTFDGNESKSSGGAIRLNKDEIIAEITDSVFVNNKSEIGGAIANASKTAAKDDVNLLVKNCTFGRKDEGNTSTTENGGAIYNEGSVATVENTTFMSNVAKKNGGAIYNGSSAVLTLTGGNAALFEGNQSQSNNGGGAINIGSGTFNVDGYTFKNNSSASQGGAIRMTVGTAASTINKSTFIGNTSKTSGGAIYKKGTVTITNSTFTSNTAGSVAGAINSDADYTLIQNCDFTSNVAATNGGAVQAVGNGAQVTIEVTDGKEHVFQGNTASGNGGAIRTNTAALTVNGYKFGGNTAVAGGAIYVDSDGSGVTFKDATFVSNSTTSGDGGAVYAKKDLTVEDCVFGGISTEDENNDGKLDSLGNTASGAGGAIYNEAGELKLNKVDGTASFQGNTASGDGGAIYVANGKLDVDGYTFVDNHATAEGGAIKIAEKEMVNTIENSVFKRNVSGSYGGAICNYSKGTNAMTIKDCQFGSTDNTEDGNRAGGNGGAIYHAKGGKITLDDSNASVSAIFKGNYSSGNGGAICVGSGTLDINGYEFIGNNGSSGGAIRLNNQPIEATFDNSVFKQNVARNHGGAISNLSTKTYTEADKAAVTFTDCTFGGEGVGNTAANNGGALYVEKCKTKIVGSNAETLIASNTANGKGGAIFVYNGPLEVVNAEISGNSASDGGAIYYNDASTVSTITNTSFAGNTASGDGGAISIPVEGTTVTITGGTFNGNTTNGMGTGIYNNGNLTVSGNLYMANDEIELAYGKVLTITGNALSEQHKGSENGLKIRVEQRTANGDVVVKCDSAEAAASLADYIASASSSYALVQKDGGADFTITGATISVEDMGFANAEEVTVSNFAQLKVAVEGAEAGEEKIVKVTANIDMEGIITVPQEAKVCITDDGQARTLSRKAGNQGSFFQTYYGTGLSLKGTEAGGLVLDGGSTDDAVKADSVSSLIIGTGTTAVENVTFQNNGSTTAELNGAFINQSYGLIDVKDSTFTNGQAANGGAIYTKAETLHVEDSSFTSNVANANGGAICYDNTVVEIIDTSFVSNNANDGGAIGNLNATGDSTESLTIKVDDNPEKAVFSGNQTYWNGGAIRLNKVDAYIEGYKFESNSSSNRYGGAIYTDSGSQVDIIDCKFGGENLGNSATVGGAIYNIGSSTIKLDGDQNGQSIFEGNSTTSGDMKGGAIYVSNGTVTVTDYTFKSNSATNGGAVYLQERNSAASFTNSVFENNTATANGGAIYNGSTNTGDKALTVTNCTFGSAGTGNKAVNGGAIYVGSTTVSNGTTTYIASTLNAVNSGFVNNQASGNGGAIYLYRGTVNLDATTNSSISGNTATEDGGAIYVEDGTLNVEGYTFNNNEATDGGAVYINAAENTVTLNGATFTSNQATSGDGGAIYNASTKTGTDVYALTVTDCTFGGTNLGNSATRNGGAIYSESNNLQLMKSSASTTKPAFTSNRSNNYGGAVYLASGEINIDDVIFNKNTAKNRGGAVYMNSGTGTIDGSEFNNNSTDSQSGGAIYKLGELTISDTDFTSNKAGSVGGAINSDSANTTIRNCNFTLNTAGSSSVGGAIQVNGSGAKVTIEVTDNGNYVFSQNSAKNGGAIYVVNGAELAVQKAENVTGTIAFNNNTASASGGAIACEKLTKISITDAKFYQNIAVNGGAIFTFSTDLTIEAAENSSNAVFEGNNATGAGGVINFDKCIDQGSTATAQITGYTFKSNTASGNGGALRIEKSKVNINNCKFASNNAGANGGAIYSANNSTTTITGIAGTEMASFVSNSAKDGGAINNGGSGTLTITGYTFTGNTATNTSSNALYLKAGSTIRIGSGCVFTTTDPNQTISGNYTPLTETAN